MTDGIQKKKRRPRNPNGFGSLRIRGNMFWARWCYHGIVHERSTKVRTDMVNDKGEPCGESVARAVLASFVEPFKHREEADVLALIGRRIETARRLDAESSQPIEQIMLKDIGERFRSSTRRNDITDKHLDSYVATVSEFAKFAGLDTYASAVTQKTASDWSDELWKSGIAPHTFNGKISMMRQVWEVLKPQLKWSDNPFSGIKKKKNDAVSRRVLSDDEIEEICRVAGDKYGGDIAVMVRIGANTGLRIGDCANLKWEDVDFDGGFVRTIQEKTGRKVSIPLLPELRTALEDHRKRLLEQYAKAKKTGWSSFWDSLPAKNQKERLANAVDMSFTDFICPRMAERQARDRTLVVILMGKTFQKAGIKTSEKKGRGIRKRPTATFHSLRHTFVSRLKMSGVSERAAMEIVGHRSEEISEIYTHINEGFLKSEMKKVSLNKNS